MRLAVLLLALIVVAAGQPVPESFVLDTGAVWWPVDSIEESPAVAKSGDNFLVVWQTRSGTQWDVHAAHVTHAGDVLDPDGFVVSACTLDQVLPQVAEGPSSCLVVWEDERSGSRWDIYGARVDEAGQVLDPAGLLIRQATGDCRSPAVAFGHGRWLVAWEERLVEGDIYCALVYSTGATGPAVPVCLAGGTQSWPAVGATDSGFVVAWEDWRNGLYPQVRCARLDPDGVVLDTGGIELWSDHYDQERPAVARCGDNVLVAWEESALLDSDIWGLRLAFSGAVLDSAPIRIGRAPGPQRRPRLVDTGQDVLALWNDSRNQSTAPDIYYTRVRPDGSLADSVGRPLVVASGRQDEGAIACGDTLSLLAWRDMAGDTLYKDIRAARLTADDSLLDPDGFSIQDIRVPLYYAQREPAVASGGERYLVVWTDSRDTLAGRDIHGLRVSCDGALLDSVPFVVCPAPGVQQDPEVAFNGRDFLVVWADSRSGDRALYGTRVDTLGQVLDTANIAISSSTCYEADVCSAGDRWLVTWRRSAGGQMDLYSTTVEADGWVTFPGGIRLTNTPETDCYPCAAYGASQFLLVWHGSRTGYTTEVLGMRLTGDGTLLDTARYYSNFPRADANAKVMFNGEDYLVCWSYRGLWEDSICCLRVDTLGMVIDSPPVLVQETDKDYYDPDAVYNGSYHYLVWAELAAPAWKLMGARVGTNAAVFDTFLLVADEPSRPVPALDADSAGRMLTVYTSRVDSLNGHPVGVDRIKGVLSPYGGVEESKPAILPSRLRAWPTPFRQEVRLSIGPRTRAPVDLFDVDGRLVQTLGLDGTGSAVWNGRDERGEAVGPGVYFARLAECGAYQPLKLVKLE